MKDLQTISCIETVLKTGVHSCKIEGRMKSPEYVAVVTQNYRMAIDGKLHDVESAVHRMKTVFSRETTSYHPLSNETQLSDKRKTDGQVKPANIINPLFPANIGLYAGVVISAKGKKLTIKAEADIGVRDLLQVFEEDGEKPVLLHVKEIHVNGKKSYGIKAGQTATIHTNCHCKHGTKLYVLSSQKIKEEFGAKVPKKRIRNKIPVDLKVTLLQDGITINGVAKHIAFNTKYPMKIEMVINRTLNPDAVKDCFSRLGNTIFELQDFHVNIAGDMFVPLSILNAIRREYFHKLTELWEIDRQKRTEKSKEWVRVRAIGLSESRKQIKTIHATKRDIQLSVKIDTIRYLEFLPLENVSLLYISLLWKDSFFYDFLFRKNGKETQKKKEGLFNILLKLRDKVVFSLPLIMRDKEEELSSEYFIECVRRLIFWGFKQFQIGNLGALEVFRDFDILLYADYQLYCLNPLSAVRLMELGFRRYTLSPEDDYQNMRSLFSEKAEVIIYQDTPLFISDVCFRANVNRSCPGQDRCNFKQEEIQNEYGDQFTVINDNCKTVVTGSKPFSLIQFLPQLVSDGQRNFRIDLCYKNYSPEMIQDLFYRIENKNMVENTITGNFKGRLW